ncbi:inactive serine/threonine-protein kinase TEX14 [Osmia lignaria lignaria]|uniref:inactive serine/threonine-protein kinase TEX14 n=1 Tax=Osmia lignaria lignaria TaxID=1437193 RepID=UPI00402BBECC
MTPLHHAAFLAHPDAIQILLENGAVVNCTDNLGRHPLHYAVLQKDVKSATILLTNNASVNVYDVFHESPLYTSVIRRPFFPMIKLLLSYGATVHSTPCQGSLGLLLEALLSMKNTSDIIILDLLFQNGADVNATEFTGLRTPMHIVAMTGNLQLATYLIEKGADLRRKNRAGKTPLEVAIMYKNFKIARLIENYFSMELKIHRTVSVTDLTSA